MTTRIFIAAGLILAGCSKPPESVVQAPTPEVHHFAPAGVLFVTEMISVTTDDGIRGIAPGTKVTLVERTAGGLKVTDGTSQFTVSEEQVTDDLDLAAAVQRHDVQTQQRLAGVKKTKAKSATYAALLAEEKQLVSQIAEARAAQGQENSARNDRLPYSTNLLVARIPAMENRLQEVRRLKAQLK